MTKNTRRIDPRALRELNTAPNGAVLTSDAEPPESAGQHVYIVDYPIDRITIGDRHRPLGDVSGLAQSMAEVGQLQPVILTRTGRLVAGNHRIAAARQLGWTTVRAVVSHLDDLDAELAEIDENLHRSELTVLEQAEHLRRREEILSERGMRATSGKRQDKGETVSPLTTADIAADIGISERSAQQRLQIARNLDPVVKARLAGTAIADSTTQLLELARMPSEAQRRTLDLIEQHDVPSVRHAAAILALTPDVQTAVLASPWRDNLTELGELGKITDGVRQRAVADLLVSGKAPNVEQALSRAAAAPPTPKPAANTAHQTAPMVRGPARAVGHATFDDMIAIVRDVASKSKASAETMYQAVEGGSQAPRNRFYVSVLNAVRGRYGHHFVFDDMLRAITLVADERTAPIESNVDTWAAAMAAQSSRQKRVEKLAYAIMPWITEYKDPFGRDWKHQAQLADPAQTNSTFWHDICKEALNRNLTIPASVLREAIRQAFVLLKAEVSSAPASAPAAPHAEPAPRAGGEPRSHLPHHPLHDDGARLRQLEMYLWHIEYMLNNLESWGTLTGHGQDTRDAKHGLRTMQAITQQELAMLRGSDGAAGSV